MASQSRGGRDLLRGLPDDGKAGTSPKHVNFPPEAGLAKIIPRSPEADEYVLYQALYDYKSSDPDDLSFKASDILQVTDEGDGTPQTWMYGRRQTGEEGHFPSTYVRRINTQAKRTFNIDMLDEDEPDASPTKPAATAATVAPVKAAPAATASASKSSTSTATAAAAGKSAPASKGAAAAAAIAAAQPEKPFVLYQALYDYNSGDPDDLVFSANDILRVFDEGDGPNSWMEGETQNGARGSFPGTYVRKMNTSRRTVSIKGLEHTQ
eukprot:m.18917 g.18917  ORF g.18917 m.18917 type:complete len:266 (+) comp7464_c0_seq1:98-895(+)